MSSYSPCLFAVKRPWQNHVRHHFSLLTDGAARKVLQQPLNSFRDTFEKTLLWFHFMIPGCFKLIVNLEHNSDVLFKLINASPKMVTQQVVNQKGSHDSKQIVLHHLFYSKWENNLWKEQLAFNNNIWKQKFWYLERSWSRAATPACQKEPDEVVWASGLEAT